MAVNEIKKPTLFGQDVSLKGDGDNRHDDNRVFTFEIGPCVVNEAKGITCDEDPEELNKMQLIVVHNTEQFNKESVDEYPVTSSSTVRYFDFDVN